ncbi:MAG: hypothetical protein KBT39_12770 [Bacteroidales bacterium]|nr:hypothetical protein [Bacteroidales bacterium]
MMRLKNIVWLLAMLLLPLSAIAQRLRITLYHTGEGGNKVSAQNVPVYSFLVASQAQAAQRQLQEYEPPTKRSGYQASGKTDKSGQLELMGNPQGYLLIDAGNYIYDQKSSAILVSIASLHPVPDATGAIYTLSFTIPDAQQKSKDGMRTTTMQGTSVTANLMTKRRPSVKAVANGRDVTFRATAFIDSTYARNDARYVIAPYLVCPAENNDTIGFFPPHVVDGVDYKNTMRRRMGYQPSHDKLFPYLERGASMRLRQDTAFVFQQLIRQFDYTRHYNVSGHVWYEDYNAVYHEDVCHLWSGNFINYNRYLDWSSAQTDVDLDVLHYEQIGKAEATPHSQSYHLEFEVGKAQLNMSDSATVIELNNMKDDIRRYYDAEDGDTYLSADTIRGYASPEGSMNGNRELARRRANTLADMLRSTFPSTKKFPVPVLDAKVVPWTEVADTLDVIGDSLSCAIASEIRGIASQYSSIDAQGRAISGKSWYRSYVLPDILPRMRRVELSYQSVTFAVRTPDEIYQLYRTNDGHRRGVMQRDYEYYELMNRLYAIGDWEGLERISRQALRCPELMEDVTRTDTLGTRLVTRFDSISGMSVQEPVLELKPETPVYRRAYPLAAYYLSRCLLHRGAVDTNLLKGYLDYSRNGRPNLKKNFEQEERGWWNEEAMVLSQVQMLCADNNYSEANFVLDDHIPESDNRFRRLRLFLSALRGDYDIPEVRDTVAASSPMNYLVAWCAYADATNDESGYRRAMSLINGEMQPLPSWGDAQLDPNDARVQYVKAICRYKLECPKLSQDDDAPLLTSQYIYDAYDNTECWAAPMLEAIRLDKSNLDYLRSDGNFNDAYRALVIFFATRLQQGAKVDDIKREYDALRVKHINSKKK